jgi:hypothetical protein
MPTRPSHRTVIAAAVTVAGAALAAPGAGAAPIDAGTTAQTAGADRDVPKRAVVAQRRGVRRIAGLNVVLRKGAPSLRQVRRQLGRPDTRVRQGRVCTATWAGGDLVLDFVTFGRLRPCGTRLLQAATLTGPAWKVRVGDRRYRIGQRKRVIPDGARRVRRWGGGGFEIASMRWNGTSHRTTALAHVGGDRIDRFYLWVGGAGD